MRACVRACVRVCVCVCDPNYPFKKAVTKDYPFEKAVTEDFPFKRSMTKFYPFKMSVSSKVFGVTSLTTFAGAEPLRAPLSESIPLKTRGQADDDKSICEEGICPDQRLDSGLTSPLESRRPLDG